ncbi:MAG: spore coat protein [Candidatus Kerfeldbacteria bacterium CG_4_10_14_0_8_um_filter_42_10]|uniref:glucose-1-phosphate thymidylyltransferase n=1 Tax=Candidatus Kerfeldbacteria bacterium CG_4_10_14_0_8_um_filter_42_10 TaxID=2014248 RepID=A0A2M7RKN6_9BACT|nr:MAG: spore coat protein [Candidatus Kerfeldbacteria bacterium CG_4_10_14_0_8_um_filter_42_10]
MKGIILAGGTGSRLSPLTKVTNKHLLPVYNKPMIYYPLQSLQLAGIDQILIVSGKGHAGHFLELLGDGRELGVHLSYAVQEEPGGIAQALNLAEDFADEGPVAVVLGDNIFDHNLSSAVHDFTKQEKGAKIFLKKVDHPEQYGIAFIKNEKIEKIVEKPKNSASNLAVIGVYFYDAQVFKVIKNLKPSSRGELEITDVNNFYLQQDILTYEIMKGWWGDAGESIDTLFETARILYNKVNQK